MTSLLAQLDSVMVPRVAHQALSDWIAGNPIPGTKAFSPGTLLIAHTIERALAEHCETVDFLRGNEAYKYFWGAQDEAAYRRAFFRGEKIISMHSETLVGFVDYCIAESPETRSFACRDQQLVSRLDP